MKLLALATPLLLLAAVAASAAHAATAVVVPQGPSTFLQRRGGANAEAVTQRRGGFKLPAKVETWRGWVVVPMARVSDRSHLPNIAGCPAQEDGPRTGQQGQGRRARPGAVRKEGPPPPLLKPQSTPSTYQWPSSRHNPPSAGVATVLGGALAHLALGTLYCWGNFQSYVPKHLLFFDGNTRPGASVTLEGVAYPFLTDQSYPHRHAYTHTDRHTDTTTDEHTHHTHPHHPHHRPARRRARLSPDHRVPGAGPAPRPHHPAQARRAQRAAPRLPAHGLGRLPLLVR